MSRVPPIVWIVVLAVTSWGGRDRRVEIRVEDLMNRIVIWETAFAFYIWLALVVIVIGGAYYFVFRGGSL